MVAVTAKRLFYLSLLFIFSSFTYLNFIPVGSDLSSSIEGCHVFFEDDSDNVIHGFAASQNGFSLQNYRTTCTFDSYFSVGGTVNLNGGTLSLQRDLIFDENVSIDNVGTIYGNGHCIALSSSVTCISGGNLTDFGNMTTDDGLVADLGSNVLTVDWNYANSYVISGESDNDFSIYSFDGTTLSYVDKDDLGDDVYSVRAHPSSNYFAIGTDKPGSDITLFLYRLVGETLSKVQEFTIGKDTKAVAWSADGNYLAAGYTSAVDVYSFNGSTLTQEDYLDYGSDQVQKKAVCWDQTGEYFAVGTENRLRIFSFDSGTPLVSSKYELATGGENIKALDWSKTGSFIAVGTDENDLTDEQVRVYEYDSDANTLTKRIGISVGVEPILDVHWNSDATKLAVVKQLDTIRPEVLIFSFDKENYTLNLSESYEMSTDVRAVRWDFNDQYLAVGADSDELTIFESASSSGVGALSTALFDNVSFRLRNTLSMRLGTTIQGDCTIDGRENKLIMGGDGVLTVTTDATLTLKNLELHGAGASSFHCHDDTAAIVLQNCKVCLDRDFVFASGSILFDRDVVFTGTNIFTYSSRMGSTISSESTLKFDSGSTFYYSPPSDNRDLLYLTDGTSHFHIKDSTLKSTETGLRLTRGTLEVDNLVTFSCAGTTTCESISFGNGIQADDLNITWHSGSELKVYGGLCYDNTG